jgi:hypothetical protein
MEKYVSNFFIFLNVVLLTKISHAMDFSYEAAQQRRRESQLRLIDIWVEVKKESEERALANTATRIPYLSEELIRALHLQNHMGRDQQAAVVNLLNQGANPNHCYEGRSPLGLAIEYGFSAIVSLLLHAGATLHLADEGNNAQTPIDWALIKKDPMIIGLLLHHAVTNNDELAVRQLAGHARNETLSEAKALSERITQTSAMISVDLSGGVFPGPGREPASPLLRTFGNLRQRHEALRNVESREQAEVRQHQERQLERTRPAYSNLWPIVDTIKFPLVGIVSAILLNGIIKKIHTYFSYLKSERDEPGHAKKSA